MAEPAEQEFLRTIFLMEAWDTVAALDRAATTLAHPGGVDDLFVVTHRLKGAASLHGFPNIAELAAEVEAVLAGHPPDMHVLATLLGGLKRALDAAAAGLPAPPRAPVAAPPAAPRPRSELDVFRTAETRADVSADPLRAELDAFFASNAEVAAYFVPEASEHLESVTATLTTLGQHVDTEALARLFRAVHTLKGAAYVVGCTRVGEVAHQMEDVLVAAREGSRSLTPDAIETLFAAEGAVRLMLGLAPDPRANVTRLVARVRERLDALGAVAPAAVDSAPPPVVETTAPMRAAPAEAEPAAPLPSPLAALLSAPRLATPRVEPRRPPRQTIRVNLQRLDSLMDLIGEMVIGRERVERRLDEADRIAAALLASRARLAQCVADFERRQFDARRPAEPAKPTTATGALSVSETFAELEFDRYDDAGIFARTVAEIAADIAELQSELTTLTRVLRDDTAHVHRITGALRTEIGRARLVPIGSLFSRFVRQGQEAARNAGKSVRFETRGEGVELDTSIIEQIVDPLLHLVQNTIAHGIEAPDERRAFGKDPVGTVTLSAAHEGGAVLVEVTDDGRGIDPDLLRCRAIAQGFVPADATLDDHQALDLVFLPGFSTAAAVTTAAGRGVGMDVVRTNVRRLNGDVEVHSVVGEGAKFTLRLPLTLLVSEALMVTVGEERLAVPLNAVQLVMEARAEDIRVGARGDALLVGEDLVDLLALADMLGVERGPRRPRRPVLVVRGSGRVVAVEVDEILNKQDIVIRPLGPFLDGVGPYGGASVGADGRVTLMLDPGTLVETAGRARRIAARRRVEIPDAERSGHRRVLLVDDSVSVRRFVGQMLEKAGFHVTTAGDGADALARLAEAAYDVVVTDLEMPRVNGYELIDDLRRRPATRHLPVVVLTTRAGDKHVALAKSLGVEHYVTKPVEEHAFVTLVTSLVPA
jgi:chemosensory pili system protein ChpA (sensor histidine kinase/response regulator)